MYFTYPDDPEDPEDEGDDHDDPEDPEDKVIVVVYIGVSVNVYAVTVMVTIGYVVLGVMMFR